MNIIESRVVDRARTATTHSATYSNIIYLLLFFILFFLSIYIATVTSAEQRYFPNMRLWYSCCTGELVFNNIHTPTEGISLIFLFYFLFIIIIHKFFAHLLIQLWCCLVKIYDPRS